MDDGWFLIEKDEKFIWVPEQEADDDEFDTKDVVWRCYYKRIDHQVGEETDGKLSNDIMGS